MRLVAVVIGAVLLAVACSNEPTVDDLAQSLVAAQPDLGEAGADCIVAQLQSSYSEAELTALVSAGSTSTEGEQDEFARNQLEALRACDLEAQVSPALARFATAVSRTAATADSGVPLRLADLAASCAADRTLFSAVATRPAKTTSSMKDVRNAVMTTANSVDTEPRSERDAVIVRPPG